MRVAQPIGLTERQQSAATRQSSALLVLGGAGSGKTTVLANRFAWLAEHGGSASEIAFIAGSRAGREHVRALLQELVAPPYEDLQVHTFESLCTEILRREAVEANVDPGFVRVTRADRSALLLDGLEHLALRHHEIRGNPLPLIGSFVDRIDLLKQEMITPEDCSAYAARAAPAGDEASDADRIISAREVEFARVYQEHERLLAEQRALDGGDLALRTFRLLHERPDVRRRVARQLSHLLVDDYQEVDLAQGAVVKLLCEEGAQLTAAGDDAAAVRRRRGAGSKNLRDFAREFPDATVVELSTGMRCPEPVAAAATAVLRPIEGLLAPGISAADTTAANDGAARFWRCTTTRAQAQRVAEEVERLIAAGTRPDAIAVVSAQGGAGLAVAESALEERALPVSLHGATTYFQRVEVRDVLAWLRLLSDPRDSSAAVRALTRAPIELHSVDVARLTQLARRRKLDMPSAVAAALEGPQLSPEGRDRAQAFLRLYRAAAAAFDSRRPDAFVLRLVERIGLRRQQVFATRADTVERLRNIARLPGIASDYLRRHPDATPRDFTRYLGIVSESGLRERDADDPDPAIPAVRLLDVDDLPGREFEHVFVLDLSDRFLPGRPPPLPAGPTAEHDERAAAQAHGDDGRRLLHVAITRASRTVTLAWAEHDGEVAHAASPFYEEARATLGAIEERFDEDLFGPAEGLHSAFQAMRDELLGDVARVGGRLGEMRLDTTLDVSQAVAHYLELLKVAALLERSKAGQPLDEAIPEVNQLLAAGASPEQRAVLESSALDDWLRDAGRAADRRPAAGEEHAVASLDPFIPRRRGAGAPEHGLMLSASDIETYRLCPLKYKFGRVFRIPQEPTINQRFGIALHTVLERFHKMQGAGREELLELFEDSWRRGGFGESDDELQFRERGIEALERYWERIRDDEGEPVWFERSFSFQLGPHIVRGRVDRVDRRPDGSYELIDYKTGKAKSEEDLQRDVQLSIYQMGASQAWGVRTSAQSYYYVMTGDKVPVAHAPEELERVRETVAKIGEGISRQEFQPTPKPEICAFCDFRIICPAAER